MDPPGPLGGQDAGCLAPHRLGCNHSAGPSEGGLGGQDAAGGFPASRRNAYPSGANAFFADVWWILVGHALYNVEYKYHSPSRALLKSSLYGEETLSI